MNTKLQISERGIEMPACVKEELLLLVSEERERKNMK